jgi:ribonuclease PH
MRIDGRRKDELRPVHFKLDATEFAEGSVLITLGKTRVLCNVTVQEGVPRWLQEAGLSHGWITGEYAMLPRATLQRTPRETNGLGGRTQEIRRLIGRSLRAGIDLEKLGPRTCIVDCDVLQADGGTRTAAISGASVALSIAVGRLINQGVIPPETLQSPIAAISVGLVDGLPMLDLCYQEDRLAEVDLNVVMNSAGQYIEIQGTAEGQPFARSMLDDLLNLAYKGIGELLAAQKSALEGNHAGIR